MLKTHPAIARHDNVNIQHLLSDQAGCSDVLKCAFSLGDPELDVYRALLSNGPMRSDELADFMGKGPSTIYRSLQRLVSCGMVLRESRNIPAGGSYFIYRAKDREQLREEVRGCMERMMERVERLLDRFEEDL